ncbi:hypothetical protein Tter_1079 [Thermobaculum terrenum ATCC BAA-798]|uniref:Uncharacterized protein n=1 Tax=Thermobaculum terrenum (strain ATCC BAA-798 / CCMEE 7001 / YNP1) TaxID=525904 RepID=D1CB30_THET1|nr:hypothetical protein [Thermobaculum terrenum]ACZ41995.1 hypothetical protein Tter_1079 [Thermobaculum terrenum ATCC BAA-798]
MNIYSNMLRIKERLQARSASPQTLKMMDKYISLASKVAGSEHTSTLRVLSELMKTPEALGNMSIYNDLAALEEELQQERIEIQKEREQIESRPIPKPKKYYKQHKNKK